ncbi:hypothetical protein KP77_27620 [Jeotgalibacillus alimentarius]|uniref:Uncharacterized protein n=1 Tax=Jeotgalibacillus alimentarius TaxID=135826 RepID=A0A0C2R8Q0_9BACL|nr:hypothetical protein KP77_27620 [Jeotgalibacillus alimentarius]
MLATKKNIFIQKKFSQGQKGQYLTIRKTRQIDGFSKTF